MKRRPTSKCHVSTKEQSVANPTLLPALREMLDSARCDAKRYEPMLNEIRQLQESNDDLQGFIDGMKKHVVAAGKMYGLHTPDQP